MWSSSGLFRAKLHIKMYGAGILNETFFSDVIPCSSRSQEAALTAFQLHVNSCTGKPFLKNNIIILWYFQGCRDMWDWKSECAWLGDEKAA